MFAAKRADTVWADGNDSVQRGKLKRQQREGTTVRPWPGVLGRGELMYTGAVVVGKCSCRCAGGHRTGRWSMGQWGLWKFASHHCIFSVEQERSKGRVKRCKGVW